MKTWLLGLMIVLTVSHSAAKEFPIFGPGTSTCREVLVESKRMGNPAGKLDPVFQGWILGYLSGLNRSGMTLMEADSSVIAHSIYSYCSNNPDDPLFLVVDVLFEQLKTMQGQSS